MKKLLTILAILVFMGSGMAQEELHKQDWKVQVLNDHTFPTMSNFRTSFVTTNVKASLGYGITSPIKITGLTIGETEILTFEGQLIFLSMEVEYQQKFNPWLAIYINLRLAGRLGSDMSTILADGVNTITGGGIGWLFRIYQSKKFNLSGTVDVNNVTGNFINVSQYFEDLINDVPDASVTKKVPSLSASAGLQAAYAFSPVFGAQFHGYYAVGETFDRQGSIGFYSFGVMGDVDFLPRQQVPVGLALSYTITSSPYIIMAEGAYTHMLAGKIAYTGSKEFELGVQYTYYKVDLESVDNNPAINHFGLIVKLYF
jgi:hypothetical protein